MSLPANITAPRVLNEAETLALTALSADNLWAAIRHENFPRPVHLGGIEIGWYAHEVDQWIRHLPRCTFNGTQGI